MAYEANRFLCGEKCDWSRSRGYCRRIGKNSKGLVFSVVAISVCCVAADFLFTANPAVIFFPASLHPNGTPSVCCRTACKHIPVLAGCCNRSELHVDYKEKCCEGQLKMKVPDMMGTVSFFYTNNNQWSFFSHHFTEHSFITTNILMIALVIRKFARSLLVCKHM